METSIMVCILACWDGCRDASLRWYEANCHSNFRKHLLDKNDHLFLEQKYSSYRSSHCNFTFISIFTFFNSFYPTVPYSLSFASWLSTHQSLQRKDVACSVSFKPQLWSLADICWPLLHSNAIEKEVAYRANEHEIMPARCPVHKKIILLLQDGFIL